jgi:hypothetical protein
VTDRSSATAAAVKVERPTGRTTLKAPADPRSSSEHEGLT